MKHTGTLNFTNPGMLSHNDILLEYKKLVDPNFKWENFTLEEQNQILKAKRSNTFLNTTKLETLFPDVLNASNAVTYILKRFTPKKSYDDMIMF
jgi:3,5-epimerase/4-reductase